MREQIEVGIDLTPISDALEEIGFNSRKGGASAVSAPRSRADRHIDDETIEGAVSVSALGRMRKKRPYHAAPDSFVGYIATQADDGHGRTEKGRPAVCLRDPLNAEKRLSDCSGCISQNMRALRSSQDTMTGAYLDLLLRRAIVSPQSATGLDFAAFQVCLSRSEL